MNEKDNFSDKKDPLSSGSRDLLYNLFEQTAADKLNILESQNILTWGSRLCLVTSKSFVNGWSDPLYIFPEENNFSNSLNFHMLDVCGGVYTFKGANHTYTDHLFPFNGHITTNSYTIKKVCAYYFRIFCCAINYNKKQVRAITHFYDPNFVKYDETAPILSLVHAPGCHAVIDLPNGHVNITLPRHQYLIHGNINLTKLTASIGESSKNNKNTFSVQDDIDWSIRSTSVKNEPKISNCANDEIFSFND